MWPRQCFRDNQLGILATPDDASVSALIGFDVAVHRLPPVERIEVEFKRGHDRIGVAKVHRIDRPLGNSIDRLLAINGVFWKSRLGQQHHQTEQVPGEDLTGEGRLLNQTIEVNVVGDGLSEIDETFLVVLSNPTGSVILDGEGLGTITNDDDPPIFITIDDVSIMEGDSGTTDFTFAVSLSAAGSGPISVDFATENGTATAGVNKDYRKINKNQ